MNDIPSRHVEEIIKKQCAIIGVDPEAVDFTASDWYTQHTWTAEQEQGFITWVAQFLIKHKYAREGNALREARKINMMYGWKTQ